jgi:hypothetical protein
MRARRFILPLFASAFVIAGCTGSTNTPTVEEVAAGDLPPSDAVTIQAPPPRTGVFDTAFTRFRFNSGLGTRERLVVRDAAAWQALWARIARGSSPPVPAVDFSTEMVIVASMGSKPTGGYTIAIERVSESGGTVFVQVLETSPGRGCGTTQAITSPTAGVVVPLRSGSVRFSERKAVREC